MTRYLHQGLGGDKGGEVKSERWVVGAVRTVQ
jgi:hypothetical protein